MQVGLYATRAPRRWNYRAASGGAAPRSDSPKLASLRLSVFRSIASARAVRERLPPCVASAAAIARRSASRTASASLLSEPAPAPATARASDASGAHAASASG